MTLREWPQRALIACVRTYRLLFSPWVGAQCRFEPTCSAYAMAALEAHGAAAGSYLAVRRVLRCQPWCAGGHDPVPPDRPRLFSWSTCAEASDGATSSSARHSS